MPTLCVSAAPPCQTEAAGPVLHMERGGMACGLWKKTGKIKAGLLLLVICIIGCSAIFLVRSLGTGEAGDHKKSVQTAAKKNDAQDQPLDI